MIVEPKREERNYDREYTLIFEDLATVDGGGPEASRMGKVRPGMGMGMMGRGAIEFVADNPGIWIHHCHNLYHLAGGMANLIKNI